MPTRIPTVNDLKVKLCYICREEERADSTDQPQAWIHPCNCTLIAHEQCLLKWIQTSQGNASRAPNALKCPQCGTVYEMESDRPLALKVLSIGNKVLQKLGRYFTVFGSAMAIGVVGTSIYICLTAYGAWAVRMFIGDEMFELILTDDPVNWPWSAYLNLPILPISLVLSRFRSSSSSMIIPLLLVWPPSSLVGERSKSLFEYWTQPENADRLAKMNFVPTTYWPPPPMFFGIFGFPLVRAVYRRCYAYTYLQLLGTPMPAPRRIQRGGLRFNEGPLVIRIRANMDDMAFEQGEDQNADGQQPAEANAANADAPVEEPNPDPNAAAIEAAEQLIQVDAASLGRRVAGALIIPAISSMMGGLLFELSKHSTVLRTFLGIRSRAWSQLSTMQQAKVGLKLIMTAFLGGSRTWVDSDPVWWRNGIGFALFVAAKDCVQLLHLWLAKRELESRRVKDRDFKGVDIRELDLLESFHQQS